MARSASKTQILVETRAVAIVVKQSERRYPSSATAPSERRRPPLTFALGRERTTRANVSEAR
jgi:hypothetical protein